MKIDEIRNFFTSNIQYKDWDFFIGERYGTPYLQIKFWAADNTDKTGKKPLEYQHCRKWMLSEWMTPTELVETAWAAVQRAELHEAAELFEYKGVTVYNRHTNVEKLVEIHSQAAALEHRPAPIYESTGIHT